MKCEIFKLEWKKSLGSLRIRCDDMKCFVKKLDALLSSGFNWLCIGFSGKCE